MKKVSAIILLILSFILLGTGVAGKRNVPNIDFENQSGRITGISCEPYSFKSAFERIEIEVDEDRKLYFIHISCEEVEKQLNLEDVFHFVLRNNKIYELKSKSVTLFTKEQKLENKQDGLNQTILLGVLFLGLGVYEAYRGWFSRDSKKH